MPGDGKFTRLVPKIIPIILNSGFKILAQDSQFICKIRRVEASVSYASSNFTSKSAGNEEIRLLNCSMMLLGSLSRVSWINMFCLWDNKMLRLWRDDDTFTWPTSLNSRAIIDPLKWCNLAFRTKGGFVSCSSCKIFNTVARGILECCSYWAAAVKCRVNVISEVLDLAVS